MTPELLLQLLLAISVILGLARIVGALFVRCGQPAVVGEMVAGILLGPSFLGWVAPQVAAGVIPATVKPFLYVLAEIGLIYFMFLVGLDVNLKVLRGKMSRALGISLSGVVVPFLLSFALCLVVMPFNAERGVSYVSLAVFIGAALSVTAFPVLARMLSDLGIARTRLGSMAIACASVDDICAWSLLAVAIAVVKLHNIDSAIPTFVGIVLFAAAMLTIGRWAAGRLMRRFAGSAGSVTPGVFTAVFVTVLLSAYATQRIGIDVIFGGFLVGVIVPRDNEAVTASLREKTHDFVSLFLLPIFFAYSGLNTNIGLLGSWQAAGVCALVILVATLGKYGGVLVAARTLGGMPPREASALGWLMNTRGLTELVILNVGLQLGVISPAVFTMFVLMALATTFFSPIILERVYPTRLIREEDKGV